MARPLRFEYKGALYHVHARGNERRKIFFTDADYNKFKEYVAGAIEKYHCLVHCYVLMNNHYHLIIETPEANISRVMHYISGSYTTYINTKRGRNGHLFQGRYKSILVAKDSYLMELSRYIHLNPVRARMVEKPEEYAYSSYNSYITGKPEKIVTTDLILGMASRQRKDA
jgi:REP element-mobilizing transposase RayT